MIGTKFSKGVFLVQNKINEYHNRILHMRINVGTKFHLKKNITQKDYFCPKKEEVNSVINISLFKLV